MAKSDTEPNRAGVGRKAAILAVAWEAFKENGFERTTMSDISARLGGSKATLYNYFASKEELFLAVVLQQGSELYDGLSRLPKELSDLPKDLTKFGLRLLNTVLSDEYLALERLIITEAARLSEISAAEFDGRRKVVLEPLSHRLHDQMKMGRLRMADPMEACEAFWNLCSATAHRRALFTGLSSCDSEELQRIVERAVSIFLAAYGLPQIQA